MIPAGAKDAAGELVFYGVRIHSHQRPKLRHEFADLARVDSLAHGSDFGKTQFGAGIDHARIHAESFAFDHAHAFWRDQPGADVGDLSILDQYRDALHLRAGHRVHIGVANQDCVVIGCREGRHRATHQNSKDLHCPGLRAGCRC